MAERPHIVILMPDQLRADSLGCAGHPQVQTPNFDRIAAEGMRFSEAITTNPLCMPARASFVSGLYCHNHGMWNNRGRLPAGDETFFHHLQRAGYYTGHIGKSHYHPHGHGHLREAEPYMHARGLDYVHETTGPWATVTTDSYLTDRWQSLGLLEAFRADYRERQGHHLLVRPSTLPEDEFPDAYVGRQAVEFIAGYDRPQPLCLFVGFGGPHEPWDAPGRYATMYPPAETPPAIAPEKEGEWLPQVVRERPSGTRIPGMTAADIARIRGAYYGKISIVDHWVGRILEALGERGMLEETFIVVWSDHGEMAGDHQRLFKSCFFRGAVNVPLILRWPGRIPAGTVSPALVEIIDVFPTLLEGLGLPPSARCQGKSLWPTLADPEHPHREVVLSEAATNLFHGSMVRTRRYKYAAEESGQSHQLFDLGTDPDEQRNLVGHPDYAEVEREMRERLLEALLQRQVRVP